MSSNAEDAQECDARMLQGYSKAGYIKNINEENNNLRKPLL